MKLSLIVCALLFCSCAAGTTEPPVTDEPAPVYQRPPPPVAPDAGDETDSNCHVDSHWANNCEITVFICNDEIKDIEVKCSYGRGLFPWEYIPDPPPPWIDPNPGRK